MVKRFQSITAWLWRLPSSEVANALVGLGLLVNVLVLVATGVLAFYSYRQWLVVDQTLQEIRKQTPAVIQSGSAAQESAQIAAREAASSDESTRETLAQMRRQSESTSKFASATVTLANTAREQLDLAERPILMLAGVKVPFVAVNKYANVTYRIDLNVDNDGRSAAMNTAVLSNLIVASGGSFGPQKEISHTCHELDGVGPLAGIMIAPGAKEAKIQKDELAGVVGSFKDALASAHLDPQTGDRTVIAHLTVCLLYRSPISQQVHHTGLFYDIRLTFSDDDARRILSGAMLNTDMIFLQANRIYTREFPIMNGVAD